MRRFGRTASLGLLPTAALAEYFYNVTKSLRPFKPIDLQARLDPVGIPGKDATDHLIMLCYREIQVLDNRAGIQPPIALGLRLNRFVQRGHAGTRTILDYEAVERAIVLKNLSRRSVAIFRNHLKSVVELLQLGAEFLSFRHRQGCDASTGYALKSSDDDVKLIRILFG